MGRAIARCLAEEGCDIAILDLDREGAEEVAGVVRDAVPPTAPPNSR